MHSWTSWMGVGRRMIPSNSCHIAASFTVHLPVDSWAELSCSQPTSLNPAVAKASWATSAAASRSNKVGQQVQPARKSRWRTPPGNAPVGAASLLGHQSQRGSGSPASFSCSWTELWIWNCCSGSRNFCWSLLGRSCCLIFCDAVVYFTSYLFTLHHLDYIRLRLEARLLSGGRWFNETQSTMSSKRTRIAWRRRYRQTAKGKRLRSSQPASIFLTAALIQFRRKKGLYRSAQSPAGAVNSDGTQEWH